MIPKSSRRWLANKTPEHFAAWLADPGASLLLAVEGEAILAVGSVRNDGEITHELCVARGALSRRQLGPA